MLRDYPALDIGGRLTELLGTKGESQMQHASLE